MPGCSLDIFTRLLHHRRGVARFIRVVIIRPNLDVAQTSTLQRGTDMVLCDKGSFILSLIHGDVPTPLAVKGLILDGDGVHVGAVGRIGVKVLDEVQAEGVVVLAVEIVSVNLSG